MKTVFVDTSYLLALELSNDANHTAAQVHWKSVAEDLPSLVLTSYIFDEVLTFFNSRNLHYKALQVGRSLLRSHAVDFIHVDEMLFEAAWELFQKHGDKAWSFTDCIRSS